MAKMKVNVNDDLNKYRFDCIRPGEVFIDDHDIFIKTADNLVGTNAVRLRDGYITTFTEDTLVTFVKEAVLNLKI